MLLKKSYFLALSISLLTAIALSYICKSSEAVIQTGNKPVNIEIQMQYEISGYALELALVHFSEHCMLDDVNNIRFNLGLGKTNYQALGCSSEGVRDLGLDLREIPMSEINL